MASEEPGLGNLAKKWVKAKRTEVLGGSGPAQRRAAAESAELQRAISERVAKQPRIADKAAVQKMKDRQEAGRVRRAERRRAKVLGLPRAGVGLTVRGRVSGSWTGTLPVWVNYDEDDYLLAIELVTPDEEAVRIEGVPFHGCVLAVPRYRGVEGSYDLTEAARAATAAGKPVDREDWSLVLGARERPYYWAPEIGSASIDVGPEVRTVTARLQMSGLDGDLGVTLQLTQLPPTRPS